MFSQHNKERPAETLPLLASPYRGEEDFERGSSFPVVSFLIFQKLAGQSVVA
jgi:hypothetical protein